MAEHPAPSRIAAIDIGTNSIRGIVAEIDATGRQRICDDEKVPVRLGEGMFKDRRISDDAWNRAIDGIGRIRKIIDGYDVGHVDAIATSAVRQARNGRAFIDAVRSETGLDVRIVSGEEEAALAAASAHHNFDMDGLRYAVIDIGGGSVEMASCFSNHVEHLHSMELGAIAMTSRFLGSDSASRTGIKKLKRHVAACLRRDAGGMRGRMSDVIGSGGTVSSLASMAMAMRGEKFPSVHGYKISRSDIVHLVAMLTRKEAKARRDVPGLNPDRADIIVAGVVVVDEIMRFLGANSLRINERGIRERLILQSLDRLGVSGSAPPSRDWRSSVISFAESCRYDRDHAAQVARLSLAIFDSLSGAAGLDGAARRMLEAAALLHDVGYLISYESHHKHSYHLISHADLFNFAPCEREIIAQVARYHRKSLPSRKHAPYAKLAPRKRKLVDMLGGVLKLADSLDRRRNSAVESVRVAAGRKHVELTLCGRDDLTVESFDCALKRDLFEIAFNRTVRIT